MTGVEVILDVTVTGRLRVKVLDGMLLTDFVPYLVTHCCKVEASALTWNARRVRIATRD